MKTKIINDLLELKFGVKNEYSKEELEKIKELRLDKYDVIGNANIVIFNELLNLPGLETLTVNGFEIDDNLLQIILALNIKNLILENCKFINSPIKIFQNEKIESLIFNNVIIDFKLFNNHHYKYVEFVNIKIDDVFSINVDELNISRATITNTNFLLISNIKDLVVNENQYNRYKELMKNVSKIIVMEHNEFVKFEVNNNG